MIRPQHKLLDNRDTDDSGALRRQLEREITCLERQLGRLKCLDGRLDKYTLKTYQEMISSRKIMLTELN